MRCILFVFLMILAYSESEGQFLKVTVVLNSTNPASNICVTKPKKFIEGRQVYIDFHADDVSALNKLEKCVNGDKELKLKSIDKKKYEWKRYKIDSMEDWAARSWNCDLINNKTCVIDIRFTSIHLPVFKINFDQINMDRTDTSLTYDAIGTYYYNENQIVKIACSSKDNGSMKFQVKDAANLNTYTDNTKSIYMWMKIPEETNNEYIDCVRNISGIVSTIRIVLKRRPIDEYEDSWNIEINQQFVGSTEDYRKHYYHYVEGEKLQITCIKDGDHSWASGGFDYLLDTNTFECKHNINCPNQTVRDHTNVIETWLLKINTGGLLGLVRSNIKFVYMDNKDSMVIHYEYEDNDNLTLKWLIELPFNMVRNYTIYKEDKLIISHVYCKKGPHTFNIPIISLRSGNHSQIKFGWSENNRYTQEILMILHKRTESKDNSRRSYLVFGISAAVAVLLFITIILTTIWIIIKKYKEHKTACDDNYENLSEDSSTNPFPPQWDNYAASMDTNEQAPNHRKTSVPKSLKRGGLPHTPHENLGFEKEEFCAIESYENTFYEKQPDEIYSYVDSNYGKDEHLYCEIN